MTELGVDIDEEILVRMQVIDLLRCKSVCKSWNSLISSDCFVKSQLKRQHYNKIGETRITVVDCLVSRMRASYELVGSSNGLVCISCYHKSCFFVVNPFTREVKELINLPDYAVSMHVSGFGYDSSIDDFKVVIGSREHCYSFPEFNVLELKKNIWRSIVVDRDYEFLAGNGILCNGALHWLHRDIDNYVIASLDLSKEVFKKTPLPKLNDEWNLGTMKDRLCVFRFPNRYVLNTDLKENEDKMEIRVMRNDHVSWERKLLPPGYDAKRTMNYVPHKYFLSGHVHIWRLDGSGAPILLRSIDPSNNAHIRRNYVEHIPLSTYSECSFNYADHVFVKSLVSPHGMGNENGSCNEERVKRKRESVISPDGDGRSVKSRRESPMSHNSDGGSATIKSQSLVSSYSNEDGRRVDRKRRKRDKESLVFHSSDGGIAKSKRQSHVSCDSDDDRKRGERKRSERVSHVFHSSDKGRAKSRWQSHVSF